MLTPLSALLALTTLADPPAPPTAAEAKKVIDYYYGGREQGPLLVELKPCLKIDASKDSPTRSECLEPVKGPVKKGTVVHAWALFLVPDVGPARDGGQTENEVTVQYRFGNEVKASIDLQLNPTLRTRAWRSSSLGKSGQWEIRIVRGTTVLGSAPVTVE